MTWFRIRPFPTEQVTPNAVKAALLHLGKTAREADGLMREAKRAARDAARVRNPIPPILQAGQGEFIWRHGNGKLAREWRPKA
jgi:hypothetical protein